LGADPLAERGKSRGKEKGREVNWGGWYPKDGVKEKGKCPGLGRVRGGSRGSLQSLIVSLPVKARSTLKKGKRRKGW